MINRRSFLRTLGYGLGAVVTVTQLPIPIPTWAEEGYGNLTLEMMTKAYYKVIKTSGSKRVMVTMGHKAFHHYESLLLPSQRFSPKKDVESYTNTLMFKGDLCKCDRSIAPWMWRVEPVFST